MNNNLIITHKDGRTWNEGQLNEFVSESFSEAVGRINRVSLQYRSGAWYVHLWLANDDEAMRIQPLDPSLYTVSPVGMIAVEKVREMIEEINDSCIDQMREYNAPSPIVPSKIISKYLGEEN